MTELQLDGPDAFRAWLRENDDSATEAWLILAKKGASFTTITYAEAVEVALEHGWIDTKALRRDEETYLQRFTPRAKRSPWSETNQALVTAKTAAGTMAPRGLAEVERAKTDGRWGPSALKPSTRKPSSD